MRRLVALLAVVLMAVALGACGVPTSSSPAPLPAADVPAGLDAQNAYQPIHCNNRPDVKTVSIYLLQAETGNLVRVNRCIPASQKLTVQGVLKLLEGGPAPNEQNYSSALSINADLVSVGPKPTGVGPCPRRPARRGTSSTGTGTSTSTSTSTSEASSTGGGVAHCGLATVRLDRYFSALTGVTPIEELAQIVWSLTTSFLGITEVRFLNSVGAPMYVETATGRFIDRPVTSNDYRNIGT